MYIYTDSPAYLLGLECFPPQCGEDTVCPVIGGHIKSPKHLWGSDSLRVHSHLLVNFAAVCHRLHQGMDTAGLSRPTGPQGHHSVTHILSFVQLDQLQHPWVVVNQVSEFHLK